LSQTRCFEPTVEFDIAKLRSMGVAGFSDPRTRLIPPDGGEEGLHLIRVVRNEGDVTSGVNEASIGRGKAYRVGEGGCPRKRLSPRPWAAAAINLRMPHITETKVALRSPGNAGIGLFGESLRPVFWHTRIVAEIDASLSSSKVSIPVVILCDRTSHPRLHQTLELRGDGL
jgi:hypothetical protein